MKTILITILVHLMWVGQTFALPVVMPQWYCGEGFTCDTCSVEDSQNSESSAISLDWARGDTITISDAGRLCSITVYLSGTLTDTEVQIATGTAGVSVIEEIAKASGALSQGENEFLSVAHPYLPAGTYKIKAMSASSTTGIARNFVGGGGGFLSATEADSWDVYVADTDYALRYVIKMCD
jgi:hypothetical protein